MSEPSTPLDPVVTIVPAGCGKPAGEWGRTLVYCGDERGPAHMLSWAPHELVHRCRECGTLGELILDACNAIDHSGGWPYQLALNLAIAALLCSARRQARAELVRSLNIARADDPPRMFATSDPRRFAHGAQGESVEIAPPDHDRHIYEMLDRKKQP